MRFLPARVLQYLGESRAIAWCAVLVPALISYGVLVLLQTDVPLIDDFWHIFAFAIGFERASSVGARVHLLLTTQVGPYKLIFDHAVVALQLLLTGHLNFPALIWMGNLTLAGIFALLCVHAIPAGVERGTWTWLLVPVGLLLFGLNYAETMDWAISGLQQPLVVLFALLSIHFLVTAEKSAGRLGAACVWGVLACSVYANGLLIWPVGLVFLWTRGRRGRGLVMWSVAAAVSLAWYLVGYNSEGLTAKASVAGKLLFFVMFCGGALENMHHRPIPYVSVLIGVAVLGVVVAAVRERFDVRNPFFACSAAWVLLSGAVVANARIAMGLQLSLSSRYKMYCDLLLIFCYVYLLDRVWARGGDGRRRRMFFAIAVAGSLVVYVGGMVAGARFLLTRRQRAEGAMRAYLLDPQRASPMFLVEDRLNPGEISEEDKAREEMNEARRLGIYTPPPLIGQ